MAKPGFSKNSEDLLEDYAVEASQTFFKEVIASVLILQKVGPSVERHADNGFELVL